MGNVTNSAYTNNNCTHGTINKDICGGWNRVSCLEENRRKGKVVHYTMFGEVHVRYSCAMYQTVGISCQHAL